MSSSTVTDQLREPPVGWRARLRQVGPGIMAAATGVGAGDLVATMVAGSRFGYTLLWAVLVGTIFKLALAEAVGRWHLTSGRTIRGEEWVGLVVSGK
jgi:Mn2+/Fe2+ NRAMP family transporter